MRVYRTIRQTAKMGILPESVLRLRQKAGKLPGFYSGKWFFVDVEALEDLLHKESMAAVIKAEEGGESATA